jgi:4-amino-4-deoxy-L-arabinose transferase-like glycosyltransferase
MLAVIAGWIWWLVMRDPEIPFLTGSGRAEWILYPTTPSNFIHPAVDVEAVFEGSFVLADHPPAALLSVRCHREGEVTVNGTPVDLAPGAAPDWKRPRRADVTSLLHAGRNDIRARVRSRFGPPALWLSIEGEGLACQTDGAWTASLAGAPPRLARLATTPMDRWPPPIEERATASVRPRVPDAVVTTLPRWAAFAVVTAALLVAVGRLRRAETRALLLVGSAALCWVALMWSNARRESDQLFGFDVEGHLTYIGYILQHGRLPLADEGWEMYQPPLYYAVAAAVLRSFGHSEMDYDTLALLRWINVAGGVVMLGALLASLRVLFPDRPRSWVIGFSLGSFLPAQLYMAHYVSNETWAAAWAAVSCCVCLAILRRNDTGLPAHVALGALLGAAMLTKFSSLIVLAPILGVRIGSLVARGERSPAVWARTVGAALLACGLVCGWHFIRVDLRFGTPIVGNWDAATGFSWWQDPGYHTRAYYTTFGRSLVEPIFSSFHSFADGVFSTAWGDGLLGGSSDRAVRPPWNYDLMTSGYLLACLPTVAIFAGVVVVMIDTVRRPSAEWALVLGVLGCAGLAVFVMTLRLPFHSQAKAFYGLSALVPTSALGARGFDALAGRSTVARALLSVLWGTWALHACASFWIRG